jgi:hypothetical protein
MASVDMTTLPAAQSPMALPSFEAMDSSRRGKDASPAARMVSRRKDMLA